MSMFLEAKEDEKERCALYEKVIEEDFDKLTKEEAKSFVKKLLSDYSGRVKTLTVFLYKLERIKEKFVLLENEYNKVKEKFVLLENEYNKVKEKYLNILIRARVLKKQHSELFPEQILGDNDVT